MLNCPSAFWVKVLNSIHGDEACFDIKGCQSNGLWARIVDSIYHLHSRGYIPFNSFRYNVGDGSLIRFWKDTWLGDLPLCTSSLDIDVGRDTPIFTLSTDNIYSVSVARKYLDDCILPLSLPCTRWYKILSGKVNIFMWGLFLDRLPHRLNLSFPGLDIDSNTCPICNGFVDSNSHVFFSCASASNIWSVSNYKRREGQSLCHLRFNMLDHLAF
nr:hypothetical protein [Tanacetum cinerariifolium]